MAYCSPDDPRLPLIDTDGKARERAVNSGANMIDAALSCSPKGYAAPVDVGPIGEYGSGDTGDVTAEAKSSLEVMNLDIAAYFLSSGQAGTGNQITKDFQRTRGFLQSVGKGDTCFIGIPESPSKSTDPQAITVAGSQRRDFPPELYAAMDNLYNRC